MDEVYPISRTVKSVWSFKNVAIPDEIERNGMESRIVTLACYTIIEYLPVNAYSKNADGDIFVKSH